MTIGAKRAVTVAIPKLPAMVLCACLPTIVFHIENEPIYTE